MTDDAPMDRDSRSPCWKEVFTRRGAKQAARRHNERSARNSASLNAYQCPHCGEWHVGNIHLKVQRRRGKRS